MNPETRFRELLSQLLDDECSVDEREELARLCREHESFGRILRDELELAELLRHASAEPVQSADRFSRSVESQISGDMPGLAALTTRLIDGEAEPYEIDEIVRYCWRDEKNAFQLRRDLKWAEILGQAAADGRSEEAFVESLATRMWAEQEQDHFVEATQSKIVTLYPDSSRPAEKKHRSSKILSIGTWATAAAAALTVAAVFLLNRPVNAVAEIVHATEDVRWKTGPGNSSAMKSGRYTLDSGVITLEFANGAEMTIEGPAEFDLRGDNEAFVHSGIAMLDQDEESSADGTGAPKSKAGFTLQSKGLNLVDTRDTVGIDARNESSTEAIVFNGGAEVCLPVAGSCRSLFEYEAVRVDLKREKLYDVPYNPRVFARSWEVLAGVERNTGSVRTELPGPDNTPSQAAAGEEDHVRIFVERERFVADRNIEVDTLNPGQFASSAAVGGRTLEKNGEELRSYLLQLWPNDSGEDAELSASVTFAHKVVGVIYSSDRLKQSDSIVGSKVGGALDSENSKKRGLDDSAGDGDSILLSEDGRTVKLWLQSGTDTDKLDHVRVLVALR